MKKALALAEWAGKLDEVPVGAVIVQDGKITGWGWNTREQDQASTGHAEINAIKMAEEKAGSWRLDNATLYVTLEPCPMCAGAIIQSRISKVVYGTKDPKAGCAGSCTNLFEVKEFNHHPDVEAGVLQEPCAQILKDFFRKKRKRKKAEKKETPDQ